MSARLETVPVTQAEAKAFVARVHRHHPPPIGSIFQAGAALDGRIVGVVMVGRPVARRLDDGWTLEVTRCATDGTRNACSFLYGTAWRVCRALGFRRLFTYTLPEEGGASLRASGWTEAGDTPGRSWDVPSRPRGADQHPLGRKIRWERVADSYRADPRPAVEKPDNGILPLDLEGVG